MFNLFKKKIHGAEVEMPLKGAFLVIQTQCFTNNGTWDLAPIYDCIIFDKEKIRMQKDNKNDENVYLIKTVHCNETDSQVLYYTQTHEGKTFLIIISTIEVANMLYPHIVELKSNDGREGTLFSLHKTFLTDLL